MVDGADRREKQMKMTHSDPFMPFYFIPTQLHNDSISR